MASLKIQVAVKVAWWVRPYLALLSVWVRIAPCFDVGKALGFIRRGIRVRL